MEIGCREISYIQETPEGQVVLREVEVERSDGTFTISVGTVEYITHLQQRNVLLPEEARLDDKILPLTEDSVPPIEELCQRLQKLPLEIIQSFS